MKVGDQVIVRDWGEEYDSYKELADKMELKNWTPHILEAYSDIDVRNYSYKTKHTIIALKETVSAFDGKTKTVAAIRDNETGGEYLLNTKGLLPAV